MKFAIQSNFSPAWDQPAAISSIVEQFWWSAKSDQVTLLWATWTWKTFTMANVIQQLQKPTLILSHNKTLAAQLATEFKHFFPNNAVHYFVSYFDYYQPESYLPEKWTYIEKEATINKEIEMYRLSTMASLLTRPDSIVVSSVSSLYWLWSKEYFDKNNVSLSVWKDYDFEELKKQLIIMQYKPVHTSVEQWMFDIQWETVDIYSSTEKVLFRLIFNDTTLELIQVKDALTYQTLSDREHIVIRPASQFLQNMDDVSEIIQAIYAEMEEKVAWFEKHNFLVEAQRLKKRVTYDMKMIKETWFVNWIENYSPYFEWRLDWATPNTLFDYFPDDCLVIVDESHMTIPQLRAMPRGDLSRKNVLVDHGFRLPSALHHRPMNFEELEVILWWKTPEQNQVHTAVNEHIKSNVKTLFVSATPAQYEIDHAQKIVQQVIRPTWLLDPLTYVYPKSGSYESLETSLERLLEHAPHLQEYVWPYEKVLSHWFNEKW